MTRDLGPAPLHRCCVVWLLATGVLASLAIVLAPSLGRAPDLATGPFEEALVVACEGVILGCGTWFWAVTSVVVLDAARGRAGPRSGVPAGLRRVLLSACGVALLGSLTVPAHTAPEGSATGDRAAPGAALVHGLPLPDRATAAGHVGLLVARHARAVRQQPGEDVRTTLVRPGDTLWGLAVRDLPAGVSDAAIARRWQEIYRANRTVIGADPDLIHPHQRLRLPRR